MEFIIHIQVQLIYNCRGTVFPMIVIKISKSCILLVTYK